VGTSVSPCNGVGDSVGGEADEPPNRLDGLDGDDDEDGEDGEGVGEDRDGGGTAEFEKPEDWDDSEDGEWLPPDGPEIAERACPSTPNPSTPDPPSTPTPPVHPLGCPLCRLHSPPPALLLPHLPGVV